MQTPSPTPRSVNPHPMIIIAAVAVVLFCLAGTAAIMGWIPSSISGNSGNGDLSDADRNALSAQLQAPPKPAPKAEVHKKHAPAPTRLAAAEPARNWCGHCGNVESVRTITTRAEGSGLGAAGGAVLGGLLGNQVGGGNGRKLATVAGAVGGAVVGNQVEGNMKASTSYEITVRMDDGGARTFHQQHQPAWHNGDRVKVVDGALRSAG